MSAESKKKIVVVALGVCIVCSLFVSTAAVTLNARQERNKKLEKLKNILQAGDLLDKGPEVTKIYEDYIEGAIIDLDTGKEIPEDLYSDALDAQDFDIKTILKDPEYAMDIPPDKDFAQLKRKPKYMAVYYVKKGDEIDEIILPLYGKGLWSTMYGFMAIDKDLRTIRGFTYYEHGETPGLGGEVDNPNWKNTWKGKKAFDDSWNIKIEVIKGRVDPSSDNAIYQVDGLSGSTLTTRGIDNSIKFWLGENGYGPFFERLREEKIDDKI
jgi:Na+-transporting NADH:ubiquinone oxidoreductase subunit C